MVTMEYVRWSEDSGMLAGYLREFPDYWTQGADIAELKANLRDLYKELSGGAIPHVRRVGQLQVA